MKDILAIIAILVLLHVMGAIKIAYDEDVQRAEATRAALKAARSHK